MTHATTNLFLTRNEVRKYWQIFLEKINKQFTRTRFSIYVHTEDYL